MSISETTVASAKAMQATLSALITLALTEHYFPAGVTLPDQFECDFIIVGSGPGGSVLANRLTEDENTVVCLIEAGGIPPIESVYPGLFTMLPNSVHDWNITSTDDGYANQYLQNNIVEMTAGKMLGGSSSLDHLLHVRGNQYDFDRWIKKTGDDSFKFEKMNEFFRKTETILDKEILAKYLSYHGTDGPLLVQRQTSNKNTNILDAFKELGHNIILDINANETVGYTEPLFHIGEMMRQSAAQSYLARAKHRPNLHVQMNALVTKIFINSSNVATGVQIMTNDGTYKAINARKEVIVSGGAIKSPQLLMLSGIGPKAHLEELNIEVKVNLPVGDNLIDHVGALVGYTLQESNQSVTSKSTEFPLPCTTGYVSMDGTKSPTYQTINFHLPPENDGFMELCAWAFKYKYSVCDALYKANIGRELFIGAVTLMQPRSTGTVRLNSVDPAANPTIHLGHLSDPEDLHTLAESLQDFHAVINTTYFKSVGSEMVDIDLPECSSLDRGTYDYWKCYAKCLSLTMWHFCGTCGIGRVLDNDMVVKGMKNLRVVDASAMPYTATAKIVTIVYALAEKAADIIKAKWCLS